MALDLFAVGAHARGPRLDGGVRRGGAKGQSLMGAESHIPRGTTCTRGPERDGASVAVRVLGSSGGAHAWAEAGFPTGD